MNTDLHTKVDKASELKESEQDKSNLKKLDIMKDFRNSTWFSRVTYKWLDNMIEYSSHEQIKAEHVGHIDVIDSCKVQGDFLSKEWEKHKNLGKYAIIWCSYSAFKWQIWLSTLIAWALTFLDTINAIIVQQVMTYIDGESDSLYNALFFVVLMALFEISKRLINTQYYRYHNAYKHKLYTGLQILIYSKIFRITSATNKKYNKGYLNNLVNSDPWTVIYFLTQIPYITKTPILMITTSITLYYLIGNAYIFTVALIFVNCFGIYYITIFTNKISEKIWKDNEDRYDILTEIIDNIKVIKMNSYTECFVEKLMNARKQSLKNQIYNQLLNFPHTVINIVSNYGLLIGIFFITIYSSKLSISVPVAITIISVCRQLRGQSAWVPYFLSELSNTIKAVDRIQDFLNCEEVEYHKYILTNEDNDDPSVTISKSNFFWGLEEARDDEEPKKKEDKKESKSEDSKSNEVKAEDSKLTKTSEKDESNLNELSADSMGVLKGSIIENKSGKTLLQSPLSTPLIQKTKSTDSNSKQSNETVESKTNTNG